MVCCAPRIHYPAPNAVGHMLDAWKQSKDEEVEAYALKELRISPQRLLRATRGLQTLQRIHEIAEITVIKFWIDETLGA